MNVIISNKYQTLLGTLSIDVIKTVNGEFTVQDLVNQFTNFYYNKMIIDVTAIKNYNDINTMRELSLSFDMSKVILLLDDSSSVNSGKYLSQLVSMGIYNFTRNINSIPFLIDNPNSYKDVASFQNLNDNGNNKKLRDIKMPDAKIPRRIIGFKNVTEHAGATTLVYMLKKHLQDRYSVVALEVNKNDFSYFNDKALESVNSYELSLKLAEHKNAEIILIDLNDGPENICNDVIYLVEPGIIKLNKLIRNDHRIFEKLHNKKIVLNKSILDNKDVNDFEYESGSKIFFNLPSLDEKLDDNAEIIEFLRALGFSRL